MIGICDFPDAASAAAVSLLINASGGISVTLTPSITAEEIDAAVTLTPAYRPPSG